MVELGKSLNKLLNGLEDLGIDAAIPHDMEMDLRHAMDLMDIGDNASSLKDMSSQPTINHPWPLISSNSPSTKRKNMYPLRGKEDIDAGNEADDDMTEEFLSNNSPYRNFLKEGGNKQVAQFFKEGLFKCDGKHGVPANIDDDEDTDADVDDVIDEEEISNFVDFLQFATSSDFANENNASEANTDLMGLAAFASVAGNVLPESALVELENFNNMDLANDKHLKDDAFSRLPTMLSLQEPAFDERDITEKEEANDIERLLIRTPTFFCRNANKNSSSNNSKPFYIRTTCSKQ